MLQAFLCKGMRSIKFSSSNILLILHNNIVLPWNPLPNAKVEKGLGEKMMVITVGFYRVRLML